MFFTMSMYPDQGFVGGNKSSYQSHILFQSKVFCPCNLRWHDLVRMTRNDLVIAIVHRGSPWCRVRIQHGVSTIHSRYGYCIWKWTFNSELAARGFPFSDRIWCSSIKLKSDKATICSEGEWKMHFRQEAN